MGYRWGFFATLRHRIMTRKCRLLSGNIISNSVGVSCITLSPREKLPTVTVFRRINQFIWLWAKLEGKSRNMEYIYIRTCSIFREIITYTLKYNYLEAPVGGIIWLWSGMWREVWRRERPESPPDWSRSSNWPETTDGAAFKFTHWPAQRGMSETTIFQPTLHYFMR